MKVNIEDIYNNLYNQKKCMSKKDADKLRKMYYQADKDLDKVYDYIKENIEEDKANKIKDILEDYYEHIDDYIINNEKVHFLSGLEYGVKFMASLYNR